MLSKDLLDSRSTLTLPADCRPEAEHVNAARSALPALFYFEALEYEPAARYGNVAGSYGGHVT